MIAVIIAPSWLPLADRGTIVHPHPMTNRAVIHVGLPKCGSSALQTRLVSNRDRLLTNGVLYPDPLATASKPDPSDEKMKAALSPSMIEFLGGRVPIQMSHLAMAAELVGRKQTEVSGEPSILERYVGDLQRSGGRTLMLSSESLAARLGRADPTLLAPLRDLTVEILLYYRRADALMRSSFKQSVRRRRCTRSFRDFYTAGEREGGRLPDIPAQLDRITRNLPDAALHIVDLDATDAADSIDVAARILGLPLTDWSTTGLGRRNAVLASRGAAVNASHGDEKTLYLLALNRTGIDEATRQAVDLALSALSDDAHSEVGIMTWADSRQLLDQFASINAPLATRYRLPLARYSPDETLPRDARRETLTRKEAARITEQLLPLLSTKAGAELAAALA